MIEMDIYAQKKGSAVPQKLVVLTIELLLVALSAWILFGSGRVVVASLFGWQPALQIPSRAYLVFAFSVVTVARMGLTLFYLMKRHVSWTEVATAPTAFALYYVGFAILVLPQTAPLGGWDYLAIVLFAVGSYLNTGSELARDRFKKNPENKGKLYVGGLFSLSRHVNFFGDILWVSAYAIVAHTAWAAIIPIYTFCFFGFFNAPALDRHLADHYGPQYTVYAARTKMLIPFVW
jgi:protein-S-isoprenylcysteine O-methyltransferase Ste14